MLVKMSADGINFLTILEGEKNKMYLDSKGLPTIGIGHLILPNEKEYLTKVLTTEEVHTLLAKDLKWREDIIGKLLTPPKPLTQQQIDAIISIVFNIGHSKKGFEGSTFLRLINSGSDLISIAKAIMMWKIPASIIGRRKKEVYLFCTNKYVHDAKIIDNFFKVNKI